MYSSRVLIKTVHCNQQFEFFYQHGRHPVGQPPETEAGPAEADGQRAAEAEAPAAGQESQRL